MFKKSLFLFGVLVLAAFIIAFSNFENQEKPEMPLSDEKFAQNALETYIEIGLTDENAKDFGFQSLEEAQRAIVSKPMNLFVISMDALREYDSGITPKKLMAGPERMYFFVTIDENVRTKIEIMKRGDQWIAGEFGGTVEVWLIDEIYRQLPALLEEYGIPSDIQPDLFQIPYLHLTLFFVETEDGELFVSASFLPQRFEMENGITYDAPKLLEQLAEIARGIEEGLSN